VKTTAFQAHSLPGGGLVRRKRNLPAKAGSGLVVRVFIVFEKPNKLT
jgi:hypothetical protein